jgi:alkylhydroperoxidase/carboxymuconolactone decarboxylase family protein YurZ
MAKVVQTRPPRRSTPVQTPKPAPDLPPILRDIRTPKAIDKARRHLAATAATPAVRSPTRARIQKESHHRIATAAEIREVLRVAAGRDTNPMMIRLAVGMLLDHLQTEGYALVRTEPD